jgi:iron-sulfur cluster assembly protein
MALDGHKENDETFNDNGITYVINSQLFEQVKPVNVDYIDTPLGSGFRISSNLESGGSCGSSCSYGSSCSCG